MLQSRIVGKHLLWNVVFLKYQDARETTELSDTFYLLKIVICWSCSVTLLFYQDKRNRHMCANNVSKDRMLSQGACI